MNLFILTGPKHSGKTTALLTQFSGNPLVGGFLSPILDGKRYFFCLSNQSWFPMEEPENETDELPIGRYRFSKNAFSIAEAWFLDDQKMAAKKLLILDEAGPLELQEMGFSQLLTQYLANPDHPDLLVVVREELVLPFTQKWKVSPVQWQILTLPNISALKDYETS